MEKFYMDGTDGTGKYVVVAVTPTGRVGYRELGSDVRVRVEPTNGEAADQMAGRFNNGWKHPDSDQFRFSTVRSGSEVAEAVSLGLKAIGAIPAEGVVVNPAAPDWAKALVACPVVQPEPEPEPEADCEEQLAEMEDEVNNLASMAAALAAKLASYRQK